MDMCVDMCRDMCIAMCRVVCMDVCTDMRLDMWRTPAACLSLNCSALHPPSVCSRIKRIKQKKPMSPIRVPCAATGSEAKQTEKRRQCPLARCERVHTTRACVHRANESRRLYGAMAYVVMAYIFVGLYVHGPTRVRMDRTVETRR